MRKALFEYLLTSEVVQKTGIKTWYGPYMAKSGTQKPYGVMVWGEDLPSVENIRGKFRLLQIWVYWDGGSFLPIDVAVEALKNLLHGKTLTTEDGGSFVLRWVYTGRDYKDDELAAIAKRIDFEIPMVF